MDQHSPSAFWETASLSRWGKNTQLKNKSTLMWIIMFFAHRSCTRSTCGSQNWAVLPKRHDNSIFCASNRKWIKTMQMVLWPLLIVNLRILGLIWWGTTYFVQNNQTVILPGDTQRTTCELPDVGAKLEAWRLKMFHNFHFLQSDTVFGIANSFSWIFDAFFSEKSYPTSRLFFLTYIEFWTVE